MLTLLTVTYGQFKDPVKYDAQLLPYRGIILDTDDNGCDEFLGFDGSSALGEIASYKITAVDTVLEKKVLLKDLYSGNIRSGFLDRDNYPDLIGFSQSGIYVYINDTKGSFTNVQTFLSTPSTYYADVQLGDIDHDGDIDLLYAFQDKIFWHRNSGDSLVSDPEVLIANIRGRIGNFLITDVNNDKVFDFIILNLYGDDDMVWVEQIGPLEFAEKQVIVTNITSDKNKFEYVDFNLDGFKDIILLRSSIFSSSVFLLFNDGNQNFIPKRGFDAFSSEERIDDFVISDFNNDGWPDMIYHDRDLNNSNVRSAKIFVKLNNKGLEFVSERMLDSDTGIDVGLFSIDLDDDGDVDLLASLSNKSEIRYYENLSLSAKISGSVFFDSDNDKFKDSTESGLARIPIEVVPDAKYVSTDEEGNFTVYLENGNYTISPSVDDCWVRTTDKAIFRAQVNVGDCIDGIDFGFDIGVNESDFNVESFLNNGFNRCGFYTPMWGSYVNRSCTTFSGTITIIGKEIGDVKSVSPIPTELSSTEISWYVDSLLPNQVFNTSLEYYTSLPTNRNDSTFFKVRIVDNIGQEILSQYSYEIRCSYDPNDKQVSPARSLYLEDNYILTDEKLTYTIRFQNTGNDTAFRVVIRDILSDQLDPLTFNMVASSHTCQTSIDDEGQVVFRFDDILLPDSVTNPTGSQGFVQFEILPKQNLTNNTVIPNRAAIYFDLNQPIITNTVKVIVVDEIPGTTSIEDLLSDNNEVMIFPNPSDGFFNLVFQSGIPKITMTLEVFDTAGKQILTKIINDSTSRFSLQQQPAGLYFYRIIDRSNYDTLSSGALVVDPH